MEQSEQPLDRQPEEQPSNVRSELLLTDNLVRFFLRNARIGNAAMILLLIAASMEGLFWLYWVIQWLGSRDGDFYLLEDYNARQMWDFASSLALILMLGLSAWTGLRSMQNISIGLRNEDDNALLDGFEQLTLAKKRFVYWGALWLACTLIEKFF